jgi:hypothetical protein
VKIRQDQQNDIVGLLLQKGKLQKEELGLIEVQDFEPFVAIKRKKAQSALSLHRRYKIKKKSYFSVLLKSGKCFSQLIL